MTGWYEGHRTEPNGNPCGPLVIVTVVGLGKIGLPLAVQCAERGHRVCGADIDAAVVGRVNRGAEPFPVEARLAEKLAAVVGTGRLTATTDTSAAVAASDAVVVAVPLTVDDDGTPDFRALDAATADIGRGLHPDTLISYETTLPVGTTRERWKPMLERMSGLTEGASFSVVHSPEQALTGPVLAELRRYPKLVGGLSEIGAKHAVAFYEEVLEFDEHSDLVRGNRVWDLGSAEAAELARLAETTHCDVNVGLANQLARFTADRGPTS